MNKLIAVVVALGLFSAFQVAVAEDAKAAKEIKGVLIDTKCGAGQMKKENPEAEAAKHPTACALKCADSGFAVIVAKKQYKFDEKGNKLAKDFLTKEIEAKKDKASTKVIVVGTPNDEAGTITVTEIKPQEEKKA